MNPCNKVMNFKCSSDVARLIEASAHIRDISVSSFMRDACLRASYEVIEHSLSEEDDIETQEVDPKIMDIVNDYLDAKIKQLKDRKFDV